MNIKHKETGKTLLKVPDDLAGERLESVNLSHANLRAKKLEGAVLLEVDLSYSDLTYTELAFASIYNTNFSYADLTETTLCEATLSGANLSHAHLFGTALQHTDLTGTNFEQADVTGSILKGTLFIDCRNLHNAVGLTEMEHEGPSILDVKTLRASVAYLPDGFLLGVGYTPSEIANLRRFYSKLSN